MIYQQKVDFQAHYLPKVYYDFLEEEGLYCPDGFPAPEWDEAWQQEAMTELCISYALLSISSPSVFTGNKFRSRELAGKSTRRVRRSFPTRRETSAFLRRSRCRLFTAVFLKHATALTSCTRTAWG